MRRLYSPPDFYRFMRDFFSSMDAMRAARHNNLVSSQFSERIMMAVTEVNGCRYCSYFHTQVALKTGLDQVEIRETLMGDFTQAPREELSALLFAQHYAESAGQPEIEILEQLMETYGLEKGRAIIGYIQAIMVGNAWGNAFDSLRFRLKGQPNSTMTLVQELGVIFGPVVMTPIILLENLSDHLNRH